MFVPQATGRPGGMSQADCLADFSQSVDGAFHLDLKAGPEYLVQQFGPEQVVTLQVSKL